MFSQIVNAIPKRPFPKRAMKLVKRGELKKLPWWK